MGFNFYNLPGEIRNQILRLLLTHNTPIVARFANQLAPPKPTPLNIWPNILLACKRTYDKGITIIYGENTFQAHPSYLNCVLFAMDPTRTVISKLCIAMIRRFHLRVRLDCDPFYKPRDVKKAFSGADELELEVFRSSWGLGGYDALEGFVGVREIRKAKVHGSIEPNFARWLEGVMRSAQGGLSEKFVSIAWVGWLQDTTAGSMRAWNQDR